MSATPHTGSTENRCLPSRCQGSQGTDPYMARVCESDCTVGTGLSICHQQPEVITVPETSAQALEV